jgi:8-oxo-dGTP pyrophosphatase MutT (NUDIX family)
VGITATVWHCLGTLTIPTTTEPGPLELHLYAVTSWIGAPVNRQPAEHDALGWFTVAAAAQLVLAHPAYPALFQRAVALHA